MSFPKMIFRAGGPYGRKGATYSVGNAVDAEHLEAQKARGWHESKEAAFGLEAPKDEPSDRDLLEEEAKRLGVSFNARTKDETLIERIEAAQEGGEE